MVLTSAATLLILLAGAWRLARSVGGRRRDVLAGWLLIVAATAVAILGESGEVGTALALTLLPLAAWAMVMPRLTRKPFRSRPERSDELSPVRRETAVRTTVRWVLAGPLGLAAALLPVLAIARFSEREDRVILSLCSVLLVWSVLAAWAFWTRKPWRTAGAAAGLAAAGALGFAPALL